MSDPVVPADTANEHKLAYPGTDLEVRVRLEKGDLALEVLKAGTLVYRVVIEQAAGPIEHAWIADLFMRDERIRLADMSAAISEYLDGLNIAQG